MTGLIGCSEKDHLTDLPDTDLLTIDNYEYAQSLLDNTTVMRETPALPEISADDYFLPEDSSTPANAVEYNAYLWKPDIFEDKSPADDWLSAYQQVYYANSVMAALPTLAKTCTAAQLNQLNGMSLFIRAYSFYNIALAFANLYSAQAETDAGIPLRLNHSPTEPSTRATLKATYDRILSDLKETILLLPENVDPKRKNRPTVPAVHALLARVYLSMRNYEEAGKYADSCLKRYASLIDYNSISSTTINPFSNTNEEVLYQTNLHSSALMFYQVGFFVDTTLLQQYAASDLRKDLYFTINSSGRAFPRASYSGTPTHFSGLATDEMYLIRAECNARAARKQEALDDLNLLLHKRWKAGSFMPLSAGSASEVLELVLLERRKELIFRGLRWTDIRRLNLENRGINLKRIVKGKEYILPAGGNRFVLPIPPDVLSSNKNMQQNPR
jgi:hypothetical protein